MINDKIIKMIAETRGLRGGYLEYSTRPTQFSGFLAWHVNSMRKTYEVVADSKYDRVALDRFVLTACGGEPSDNYTIVETPTATDYSLIVVNWSPDADLTSIMTEAVPLLSTNGFMLIHGFDEDDAAIVNSCNLHNLTASRRMLVGGVKENFTILRKAGTSYTQEGSRCDSEITIALVLKAGGDTYNHRYVNALATNIKKHVSVPHKIVCLTDDSSGIDQTIVKIIPLKHGLPKWWSKVELFNSANFDTPRVFYIDLDTVLVGNIDHILHGDGHQFVALRDFYHMFTLQTGIMCWNNGEFDHIYEKFIPRMHYFASPEIGDHVWIGENCTKHPAFFQDIYGNEIVSYKKDCKNGTVPRNAKIVCFHGNPRPHAVRDEFVLSNWVY